MLARSQPTNRVEASAICTSSGSISRVWYHCPATFRIASRRPSRRCSRSRSPHSLQRMPQHRRDQFQDLPQLGRCIRPSGVNDQQFGRAGRPQWRGRPRRLHSGLLLIEHVRQPGIGKRHRLAGINDRRPPAGSESHDGGIVGLGRGKQHFQRCPAESGQRHRGAPHPKQLRGQRRKFAIGLDL